MLEQTRAVLGLACLAAALFPHAASAQVIDVAINGRVTDRAGRALPGSVVTVLNEETGLTRTAAADTTGAYRLPALPAGAYTMKAELAGFQPVVRRGQTLHVGTAVAIDFVLDATAATTVEVAATVPLLETTRNTLSCLISRQELETLPVIDRKFNALAALAPERLLVFCDEGMAQASPVAALASHGPAPLAVLIGPEGGFDEAERSLIRTRPNTLPISLGPRILRADTAAVAALALVQAVLGDWPRA